MWNQLKNLKTGANTNPHNITINYLDGDKRERKTD
jgi:hypothetical protein